MIIDCHGHTTTHPPAPEDRRARQTAAFAAGRALAPDLRIGDDEIRETLEARPNRVRRERGHPRLGAGPVAA